MKPHVPDSDAMSLVIVGLDGIQAGLQQASKLDVSSVHAHLL